MICSEKSVERRLVRKVKAIGGRALKFTSPGFSGVPDRIVLLPGGRLYFVELKRDDGNLTPIQRYVFNLFEKLGFPVRVLYGIEMVDDFISEVSKVEV